VIVVERQFSNSLVLCVCFVDRCLSFRSVSFWSLSVLLRYTDPNYTFGIIKLFL